MGKTLFGCHDCKGLVVSLSIRSRSRVESEIEKRRKRLAATRRGARNANTQEFFEMTTRSAQWSTARSHLAKSDPILPEIADAVGRCTLKPNRDHFTMLCKSIYSQQISSVVAAVSSGA